MITALGSTMPRLQYRSASIAVFLGFALLASGCQQKMAEQPALRPYQKSALFKHHQSARPLEVGVIHSNQRLHDDPLANWLTPAGHAASKISPDWADSFKKDSIVPPAGAPVKPDHFVAELPFRMSRVDLERGQYLYNTNCALCHGAAGYADGKIPERGYLRPPSYHVDPTGKQMDWSTLGQPSVVKPGEPASGGLPMGYSRGFYRWGLKIPLKDVPVGYIFQVITMGYGGMGSHDVQLPDLADRWRVVAYVRTLQLSQSFDTNLLPEAEQAKVKAAGKSQQADGEASK